MKIKAIPFGTPDWSAVPTTQHQGEAGITYWRTQEFSGLRVRMVEYTPGYVADHWCSKGQVLQSLEGELETELADGRRFTRKPGMRYQVAHAADAHKSSTGVGVRPCIVD